MKFKALLILSVLSFSNSYSIDNNKSLFEKTKQWIKDNKQELVSSSRVFLVAALSSYLVFSSEKYNSCSECMPDMPDSIDTKRTLLYLLNFTHALASSSGENSAAFNFILFNLTQIAVGANFIAAKDDEAASCYHNLSRMYLKE
ncbi:MAG: hypothetical protein P4L22_07360 [Candidatus Babeliales bacterium]|nr:hypothetical protein [Candidatus Babeliales bacterium]